MVTATTKVIALIGDPVEKSLSPQIHNAAFKALNLDYVYVAFRVAKQNLSAALNGVRALGIEGLNVTTPHKVEIVSLLDALDTSASLVGAVNTVKNNGGKLVGYNTDGEGAAKVLEEKMGSLSGRRILLLGAGGAARAISFSLAKRDAIITVANRTFSKARELASEIERKLGVRVNVIPLDSKHLAGQIKNSDVLINATTVGMYPRTRETLVISRMMHDRLTVFDIVYQPLYTRLLYEARRAGARIITGLEMLVRQAALSFEIWTGREAPLELMRSVAWRSARAWRYS